LKEPEKDEIHTTNALAVNLQLCIVTHDASLACQAWKSKNGCSFEIKTFYSSQNPIKLCLSFQVFSTLTLQKCFSSSRSVYKNDFWRIMWHWRLK